jgi:hypothetical protein
LKLKKKTCRQNWDKQRRVAVSDQVCECQEEKDTRGGRNGLKAKARSNLLTSRERTPHKKSAKTDKKKKKKILLKAEKKKLYLEEQEGEKLNHGERKPVTRIAFISPRTADATKQQGEEKRFITLREKDTLNQNVNGVQEETCTSLSHGDSEPQHRH